MKIAASHPLRRGLPMNDFIEDDQEFQLDLKEYLRIILKRKKIIAFIVFSCVLFAGLRTFTKPNLYTARSQIHLDMTDLRIVDKLERVNFHTTYELVTNTQIRLLGSTPILSAVAEKLGMKQIDANFNIVPVQDTELIDIVYTAADPVLAAKLANAHAEVFIDYSIRKKYETTAAASDFITEQIQTVQNEIISIENQLQDYIESKEIIKVNNEESMNLSRLSMLNSSLTQAETERMNLESRYKTMLNSPPESLPEVQQNSLIMTLKKEYSDLETTYQAMSKRFQSDWPELKRVKTDMEETKNTLNQEINRVALQVTTNSRIEYQDALQKETELRKRYHEERTKTQDMEKKYVEYNALKIKLDNKKRLLSELLMKESETEVTARLQGLKTSYIRIVEQAVPNYMPSYPRHQRTLLIGLLFGLVFGFGAAFGLEFLDNRFTSDKEVEQILNIPFLGFVPLVPTMKNSQKINGNGINKKVKSPRDINTQIALVVKNEPKSPLAEVFKSIRTSILFSSDNGSPKIVLITSSQPKEGKTTSAVNLAISMQMLDKKVVIVDADMRNPQLHKYFNLDNSYGLSKFLQNNVDKGKLLQPSGLKDLFVITSGPRPQNPSELLSSSHMIHLIDKLKENFDFIVIDSPPVIAVTDSIIISRLVDSVVLIINSDKTPKEMAIRARDKLLSVNSPLQGAVLNFADTSKNSYYQYYYYRYDYYPEKVQTDNGADED